MKNKDIHIIGISGSLRSQSSNTILLHAIAAMLPADTSVEIYDKLDRLPHFNPDLDREQDLKEVAEFREKLRGAGAVIISTPEYAFGVPGVLKNALDWLVSSGEMNEKPVMAISASPLYGGGDKALNSLLLTLTALGTDMRGYSSYSIPSVYKKLNGQGELTDPETAGQLASLIGELCEKVRSKKAL